MIPAGYDHRVIQFARGLDLGEQRAETRIDGLAFAQVIGHVFADFGDVGEEAGQLALEGIGIDSPMLLPEPLTQVRWVVVVPN